MWRLILFLSYLHLCQFLEVVDGWLYGLSPFSHCGADEEVWELTSRHNEQAIHDFQVWITRRQFDSDICSSRGVLDKLHDYGIGSAFIQGAALLGQAIEQGKIYRPNPTRTWLWAESVAANCSLGIKSLDCFNLPISVCGLTTAEARSAQSLFKNSQMTASQTQSTHTVSICHLALRYKKPLIWIFGQLLDYLLRPRPELIPYITHRIQAALQLPMEQLPYFFDRHALRYFMSTSTIAVHIRGGNPDAGRKVIPLSYYIAAIDAKAKELAESNRPVRSVYVCSDDPSLIDELRLLYRRPWPIITLPHLILGKKGVEQEDALRAVRTQEISRRTLVMEYLADIEILTAADVFIGSHSNVYAMAASLRLSRHADTLSLNSTCLIDYRTVDKSLHCEGSVIARKFWSSEFIDLGFQDTDDGKSYWKL